MIICQNVYILLHCHVLSTTSQISNKFLNKTSETFAMQPARVLPSKERNVHGVLLAYYLDGVYKYPPCYRLYRAVGKGRVMLRQVIFLLQADNKWFILSHYNQTVNTGLAEDGQCSHRQALPTFNDYRQKHRWDTKHEFKIDKCARYKLKQLETLLYTARLPKVPSTLDPRCD